MIDFILLLFINALAIVGIFLAFGKEMIFESVGIWVEKRVNYSLTYPFYNCPTCMASIHSIIPYWYFHDMTTDNLLMYIIYVPALSTVATWMAKMIEKE